jgi:predicted ATPase
MPAKNTTNGEIQPPSISSIAVSGFKSIAAEQRIDVRPLTLLAGANSSGKSSMMQAVLLLKQTLEASYDPGSLLLSGANVRFTSSDQMLFHAAGAAVTNEMTIRLALRPGHELELVFGRQPGKRLEVRRCLFKGADLPSMPLTPDMPENEIVATSPYGRMRPEQMGWPKGAVLRGRIVRDRCFLRPIVEVFADSRELTSFNWRIFDYPSKLLQDIIHLPGLRGNPERAYPLTAVGPEFPGTFEKYTASVVSQWSNTLPGLLKQLGDDLSALDLTWKVEAKALDDTQVELQVGRLRKPQRGGSRDLVNIADVGFGVSQTLPVLVALLVAQPGQLLYIEQPEIHLHPRAQVAMASLLAKAAQRGVHVVVETHSSLLLLGVQSQVAERKLPPDLVKLHWFTRNETDGVTTVASADLDEAGRFGDWPEDFDDVTLQAQKNYLDAADRRLFAQ